MEPIENSAQSVRPRYFTPDDLTRSLAADFLSADRCRSWVLATLHPEGAHCPYCGRAFSDSKRLQHFQNGDRLRCASCKRFFTALTGTFLSGTHMSFQQVVLLCLLINCNLDVSQAARLLGEHPDTVRLWKIKFKNIALYKED
jgi:transposase-like protein